LKTNFIKCSKNKLAPRADCDEDISYILSYNNRSIRLFISIGELRIIPVLIVISRTTQRTFYTWAYIHSLLVLCRIFSVIRLIWFFRLLDLRLIKSMGCAILKQIHYSSHSSTVGLIRKTKFRFTSYMHDIHAGLFGFQPFKLSDLNIWLISHFSTHVFLNFYFNLYWNICILIFNTFKKKS